MATWTWLLGRRRRESLRLSLLASRAAGGIVRVFFDGEDWIHRWRGGVLVWHAPLIYPRHVTEVDLPLFTHEYRPQPGDIVVDVGAGAGAEVGPFSRMVGPLGRVIAIEPDPVAFRRLSKLVELARLTNVITDQRAVGTAEGLGHLTQDGLAGTTNHVAKGSTGGRVDVRITTLDAIVEEFEVDRVDYLKMNIEGSETMALTGFMRNCGIVRNWCIACHDFLGTPETETLAFVHEWLVARGLEVERHPEIIDSPWMGWYLYASRHPDLGTVSGGVADR